MPTLYNDRKPNKKVERKKVKFSSVVLGYCAGTSSLILTQPLDLIKTRLQSKNVLRGPTTGMVNITRHVIRNENVFGLWRGLTPSIIKVVPGIGIYFASLHWLKRTLNLQEPLTSVQTISLGMTARSMYVIILNPITVVKTRFESDVYKYGSIREALRVIYKHEGVRGLACGLWPTLLRDAPFSGLYLTFYTRCKDRVPEEYTHFYGPSKINIVCSLLAGLYATVITQPVDVIKTKLQLYPDEFKNLDHCITSIYHQNGVSGFFQGIVPRALRRTLVLAMTWAILEELTRMQKIRSK